MAYSCRPLWIVRDSAELQFPVKSPCCSCKQTRCGMQGTAKAFDAQSFASGTKARVKVGHGLQLQSRWGIPAAAAS